VTIEIRAARGEDADAIADVWLTSFKATYSFPPAHPDEDVRRWIREQLVPGEETFVAVDETDEVVAVMALGGEDLDQLYVRPGHFDRGIGSRLVDLAKERRPNGLGLYTFQVNDRARRFYERRGFRAVWFGDGEANEERQPDVRYEWRPGE
jgi:ribosomal protein S18 acetylase RimI-like enzyme